ncbi:MAG: GC-type dockerin domain-anchored protein [bacterium]|jgi:hypothetical protein|nr:hypothetical protein [Phycisphaerales bacterium]
MKTSCLSVLVAACSVACAFPVAAQPVNDTCQNAIPVGIGLTPVSVTGATADAGFVCNYQFPFAPNAVWYRFTAPATGLFNIDLRAVDSQAFIRPNLAVYDTCGGTVIACSFDSLNFDRTNSDLALRLTAGQTVLIATADIIGVDPGDLALIISQSTSGFPITSRNVEGLRPNVPTTDTDSVPNVGIRWYRFQIPQTIAAPAFLDIRADQSVTPIFPAGNGLTLALYTDTGVLVASDEGDGDSPTEAALTFGASSPARANGFGPPFNGRDGATLAPGEYFLAIARRSAVVGAGPWEVIPGPAANSDITAAVQWNYGDGSIAVPANDNCAAAIPIAEGSFPFSTVGATTDGPPDCGNSIFGVQRDIWFRYTPSATGRVSIDILNTTDALDSVISIHPACGLPAVRCVNYNLRGNTPPPPELDGSRIDLPVTAGQSMLLRISGWAAEVGVNTLNIRLLPPACTLAVPADAVFENEGCTEEINPGCVDGLPAGTQPLALNTTVLGNTSGTERGQDPNPIFGTIGGRRDEDWYAVTLDQPSRLAVTFASQFPVIIRVDSEDTRCIYGLVPGSTEGPLAGVTAIAAEPCNPTIATTEQTLPAGTYYVGITNYSAAFNECGSGYNQYTLKVAPAGVAPVACNPADITAIGGPPSIPDGLLTGDDFNAFISAFAAGDLLADITGIGGPPSEPDGLITGDDFNAFISAFAAGCP